MIKSEKSLKFTLKFRKIPPKTLKFASGLHSSTEGVPGSDDRGGFSKFSITGVFLADPPLCISG